ncbi:hypothetical protein EV426DRAFT_707518 [Tirmania nivea]|nr:hypothetical protein EV426DRAFT_707518 [Tirmania nivea]
MSTPSRSTPVRSPTGSSAPCSPYLLASRPLNPRAPAFIPNCLHQTPIIVDSSTYNPRSPQGPDVTADTAPWRYSHSILHRLPVHIPASPQRVFSPRLVTHPPLTPPLALSPPYRVPPNGKTHRSPGTQTPEDIGSLRGGMTAQPAGTPGYVANPREGPPSYYQGPVQQGLYNQGGYNLASNYHTYQQQYISQQDSSSQSSTNVGTGNRGGISGQGQSQYAKVSQEFHGQSSQQPYIDAQHQPHYTQTRQYHVLNQHSYADTQDAYSQDPGLRCYCSDCVKYRKDMEWYETRANAHEMAQRLHIQMQYNQGICGCDICNASAGNG